MTSFLHSKQKYVLSSLLPYQVRLGLPHPQTNCSLRSTSLNKRNIRSCVSLRLISFADRDTSISQSSVSFMRRIGVKLRK